MPQQFYSRKIQSLCHSLSPRTPGHKQQTTNKHDLASKLFQCGSKKTHPKPATSIICITTQITCKYFTETSKVIGNFWMIFFSSFPMQCLCVLTCRRTKYGLILQGTSYHQLPLMGSVPENNLETLFSNCLQVNKDFAYESASVYLIDKI